MKGTVIGVQGDRCAVEAGSAFTIFRIEGAHSTEAGDVISGQLEALGRERFFNETKQQKLEAFIPRWGCPRSMAEAYLAQGPV